MDVKRQNGKESGFLRILSDCRIPAIVKPYYRETLAYAAPFELEDVTILRDGWINKRLELQAEVCFSNLFEALEVCAVTISNIVELNCYLADMRDFDRAMSVYRSHFKVEPERVCFMHKDLPPYIRCQLEIVAVV